MKMDQYKGCLVMADILIKMLLVHCSRFPQRRHTMIQPLPGSFVLICSCSLFHPDLPIKFYSFIHSLELHVFFLVLRCREALLESFDWAAFYFFFQLYSYAFRSILAVSHCCCWVFSIFEVLLQSATHLAVCQIGNSIDHIRFVK